MDSDLEAERPLYIGLNLAQHTNLVVLYGQEMDNILARIWLQRGSLWGLCPTILYILASANGNMRVGDLCTAIELKSEVLIDSKTVKDAVKLCPTMLGIEKDFVYFTHPAAREYVESKLTDWTSAFPFRPSLGNAPSGTDKLDDSSRQALAAIQKNHQAARDGHASEDPEDSDSLGSLPELRMFDRSRLRGTILPATTAISLPETKVRASYLEPQVPPCPAAAITCFSAPEVEQEGHPEHPSIRPSPAVNSLPPGWEMDYDGKGWFYQYKPTGFVQYEFPKEHDPHTAMPVATAVEEAELVAAPGPVADPPINIFVGVRAAVRGNDVQNEFMQSPVNDVIPRYDQNWSDQLLEIDCAILKDLNLPGMTVANLASILREFVSRLQSESLTFSQWKASVAMGGMTEYVECFSHSQPTSVRCLGELTFLL
jgi:hypothetical protein